MRRFSWLLLLVSLRTRFASATGNFSIYQTARKSQTVLLDGRMCDIDDSELAAFCKLSGSYFPDQHGKDKQQNHCAATDAGLGGWGWRGRGRCCAAEGCRQSGNFSPPAVREAFGSNAICPCESSPKHEKCQQLRRGKCASLVNNPHTHRYSAVHPAGILPDHPMERRWRCRRWWPDCLSPDGYRNQATPPERAGQPSNHLDPGL